MLWHHKFGSIWQILVFAPRTFPRHFFLLQPKNITAHLKPLIKPRLLFRRCGGVRAFSVGGRRRFQQPRGRTTLTGQLLMTVGPSHDIRPFPNRCPTPVCLWASGHAWRNLTHDMAGRGIYGNVNYLLIFFLIGLHRDPHKLRNGGWDICCVFEQGIVRVSLSETLRTGD